MKKNNTIKKMAMVTIIVNKSECNPECDFRSMSGITAFCKRYKSELQTHLEEKGLAKQDRLNECIKEFGEH